MKISKEERNRTRRRLIVTSVEIISRKGFHETTMKEIAAAAGLSSATIYHYFSNKDQIFYAYFEETHRELSEIIASIPGFSEKSLKEKLKIQLTGLLDLYGRNREFIALTQKIIFDSPLQTFSELRSATQIFTSTTESFLLEAVWNSEIPETPAIRTIANLYWDYVSLVLYYWLKDTSDDCINTRSFIDIALDLFTTILKSGIANKVSELIGYFLRTHLYSNLDTITKIVENVK